MAKARASATPHGRPKLNRRIIDQIQRLRHERQCLQQIARILNIPHQTEASYAPRPHRRPKSRAGLLLLIYRPFQRHDRIAVLGFEGVVSESGRRYMVLETEDHTVLIPNANLFTNPVSVFARQL